MKRWAKWANWFWAMAVVMLVAWGALRAVSSKKDQQLALSAATAAKEQRSVELAPTDVVRAGMREVLQGLPVSGALRAVNSAFIKARVSGELRELTVREGDFVKAGQVIARIDASEYQSRVQQASEQAASAKAQVEVVQRQYDNNKALVAQGFISKTALDASQANLDAAQSTYKAAVAGADVARKSVADTVLRSPIAGQVSQRLAQPGERVGIDARIVEIVDLRELELEATLGAAESVNVRVGQTAELQIDGIGQPVTAKVVRINPSAQAGSRSVLAYLSLTNPEGTPTLRQGLFVRGSLGTARASVLALPVSAVRTDKPAPYVQAIEDGKIVHKPVRLGQRGSAGAEPVVGVGGVADNALVVRGNIGFLREGTSVRFTAMDGSASSPAGGPSTASAPGGGANSPVLQVKPAP
jgi:membrane fusion protein, multidrug efflux system